MKNKKFVYAIVKRIASLALSVFLILGAVSCENAQSGTNGKNGVDGKDGRNGTVTAVGISDGEVSLDGVSTDFGGKTLSGKINVSANDSEAGKVTGDGKYAVNTAVIISAEPNDGYVFTCWENEKGEKISSEQSFITRASESEQNYTAIFDIDKENVSVNVYVRADKSLPDSATVEGGGNYRYGEEYFLTVSAEDESVFEKGLVYFCEVTRERFEDENFSVTDSTPACSRGKKAAFNVEGTSDKYYIAAFKKSLDDDVSIGIDEPGFIEIIASCAIEIKSSSDFYGKALVTKINDKEMSEPDNENLPLIWPGDEITIKATPVKENRGGYADARLAVKRSEFVHWLDENTGEVVSEKEEYSFIAKDQIKLKAVFLPKTVVHCKTPASLPHTITKNGLIEDDGISSISFNGAYKSFYPGEEVILGVVFIGMTATVKRLEKVRWEISYDNQNWKVLSYDRQIYLKIVEGVTDIYLRVTFDK